MATSKTTKKVVKSTVAAEAGAHDGSTWQPRPEDRSRANRLRVIALVLWVVAIAVECVVIFGLLLKSCRRSLPAWKYWIRLQANRFRNIPIPTTKCARQRA